MKLYIKNLLQKLKSINYRHYICAGITLCFALLNIFVFKYSFPRIWESIKDFGSSCKYYFMSIISPGYEGYATVNELSSQPWELVFNIPSTWEEFLSKNGTYWNTFINLENFRAYNQSFTKVLYYVSQILIIIIPIISIFLVIGAFKSDEQNNNYNQDTKALVKYKAFLKYFYEPIRDWLISFKNFITENAIYKKIWLWIWAINFNVVTIFIEFIAFYFYFVSSFKFATIYLQVYKLVFDLSVAINFVPLMIWLTVGFMLFDKICKNIGYKRLQHFEAMNCGFINERPIVMLICGTMGKKKTTLITDMALSEDVILRDKAFEKILECDLKFPYFPWINLENELKKAISKHKVFNLATCRKFIKESHKRFLKSPTEKNIYDYDYKRWGYCYNDNLSVVDIWEVIETYAQLYFIYVIECSLIVSNYSIRIDTLKQDLGNFPLWNNDFFKKDSRLIGAYSRHSHILDFDSFRLGKKVLENNKYADALEFGVFNMTEIGKERGNALDLQEVKKKTEDANQKNDHFNSTLKLIRHGATVDNYPFIKIITDEQRSASWGADARELCDIVNIDECSDFDLIRPGFHLRDLIIGALLSKFENSYYTHRFNRGDNTLKIFIFKQFISKLYSYRIRTYNTFGFYRLNLAVEKGTQDGASKVKHYYLSTKKIYAKRFSTDCYNDIFTEKSLRSTVGLIDIPEYKGVKATLEELMQQNSYFFNDLLKIKNNTVDSSVRE